MKAQFSFPSIIILQKLLIAKNRVFFYYFLSALTKTTQSLHLISRVGFSGSQYLLDQKGWGTTPTPPPPYLKAIKHSMQSNTVASPEPDSL